MASRLTLIGDEQLQAKLRSYPALAIQALRRGLDEEAHDALAASRGEVPVDTGRLRDSGKVGPVSGSGAFVEVSFGYDAEYALIVHEDMNNHHPDGNAKFLEGPALGRALGLGPRLGPELKAVLR